MERRARKIASPTSRGYCVFQSGYQNVSPTGYLKYRAPAGPYKLFNLVFIKLKAIKFFNALNGIRNVLIIISRGLTVGDGKARMAKWLD